MFHFVLAEWQLREVSGLACGHTVSGRVSIGTHPASKVKPLALILRKFLEVCAS